MGKLLYIEASPRDDASYSSQAAKAILDAYRDAHHGHSIETLDLWEAALPPFTGRTLTAKYARLRGQPLAEAEAREWLVVERVVEQFKSADCYLLAIPMWNFSIPYVLKHYIDVLVQPGLTFGRSPEGKPVGLVTGKKAICVFASGANFAAGAPLAPFDYQRPYIEWILNFIGVNEVRSISVAPTNHRDEEVLESLEHAVAIGSAWARDFL